MAHGFYWVPQVAGATRMSSLPMAPVTLLLEGARNEAAQVYEPMGLWSIYFGACFQKLTTSRCAAR